MTYTVDDIVELAQEVELGDSIDWTNVHIEKDRVYQVIGSQVYEQYHEWAENESKEVIMLATITKLVVENFLLNVKLESGE